MKSLKTSLMGLCALVLLLPSIYHRVAHSQNVRTVPSKGAQGPPTGQANVAARIIPRCPYDPENNHCTYCVDPTEAPTGFDNATNGFKDQATHDENRATFEVRDQILPDHIQGGGLGPVYNAQSCAECHQNPVSGGVSQITELRAGFIENPCDPQGYDCPRFVDPPGGSLINDRAVDMRAHVDTGANIQERVPPLHSAGIDATADVQTPRTSLNLLGDGFVEAIANQTLVDIANSQPNDAVSGYIVHGQALAVPMEETRDSRGCRIGRFGHKDQHASLLSFSADAYLNEIGITNRFFLMENTSLGRSVDNFDFVSDAQPCNDDPAVTCGEDKENDIDAFTDFMRSSTAPPRDREISATSDARDGERFFTEIGCAVCHVATIVTAPAGTEINLGTFTVPPELGDKIIHPYGDFLLHNINTGDGIVQNGGPDTQFKVRTAPLWGVRTHTRLMHDGKSLTFEDAISRHGGEAEIVRQHFDALSPDEKRKVVVFLESL